jgi:DNA-binding Lrp family transcriptional regulator
VYAKNIKNQCDSVEWERGSLDKKNEQKLQLLLTLIKGARRSDKELSKLTGNTRATVTRRRRQLEAEGYIREYTVLPEFTKIGYNILAFTFLTLKVLPKGERGGKLLDEWFERHPFILFAAGGEGLATNTIMSLHRDYTDFSEYISTLREDTQDFYENLQFFIVDLARKESILEPFSLARLDPKADISQKDYRLFTSKKAKPLGKEQPKKMATNLKSSNQPAYG